MTNSAGGQDKMTFEIHPNNSNLESPVSPKIFIFLVVATIPYIQQIRKMSVVGENNHVKFQLFFPFCYNFHTFRLHTILLVQI